MLSISFVSCLSNFKSSLVITLSLGKNKYKIKIEKDSVNIFNKKRVVTTTTTPYLETFGNKKIININLKHCSKTLLIICGAIFCLP